MPLDYYKLRDTNIRLTLPSGKALQNSLDSWFVTNCYKLP